MHSISSLEVQAVLDETRQKISAMVGTPVMVTCTPALKISVGELMLIVSEVFKLSWDVIKSESLETHPAMARHIFTWIAQVHLGLAPKDIGFLISRDRTSIRHAITKTKNMLDIRDVVYLEKLNAVEAKLFRK